MTAPSTRREPDLPDDDWPRPRWIEFAAVLLLLCALVIGVTL